MTLEGIHEAHLIQVECVYNRIYGRGIEFLWRLEGSGQTIRSRLWMVTHEGRPNMIAIKATQRWAREWDGRNPLWFVEHLDLCRTYAVKMQIVSRPALTRDSPAPILHPTVQWIVPE